MIDKLKLIPTENETVRYPDIKELMNKINEIIDVVNTPQMHYPQVDGVTASVVLPKGGELMGGELYPGEFENFPREDGIIKDSGLSDEEVDKLLTIAGEMSRGISREKLKEMYSEAVHEWEKKEGKWLAWEDESNTFECSLCHEPYQLMYGTPIDNKYNFCPNCGARLKAKYVKGESE